MIQPSTVLLVSLFILGASISVPAQPMQQQNAAEIQLALEKLRVVGSALYVAAHPDDENTAVISWLSSAKKVRTAYLSLTRGDGGQNLLGSEKGALIGVLRTEELLAARAVDGGEQFFSRAVDFGYSKTPEETLDNWGREAILSDMVRVIRQFQPDIIITRFPSTGEGRHGHHTASAILAEEAIDAAADPARFPEQLATMAPWRAKRLLWNSWLPEVFAGGKGIPDALSVDVGDYNHLLGKSYLEIAAISRSQHKCQGFGTSGFRGTRLNYFAHTSGEAAAKDLFEGIDLSWRRIPGGGAIDELTAALVRDYDPSQPAASIPGLVEACRAMEQLPSSAIVNYKLESARKLILQCAGLWMEALADRSSATPGDSLRIATRIVNRSDAPLQLRRLQIRPTDTSVEFDHALGFNAAHEYKHKIKLPTDMATTQPYWLRLPPNRGLYTVPDSSLIGRPWNPPAVQVEFVFAVNGYEFSGILPLLFHWTDPVNGEKYRPFEVAPPLSLSLDRSVYLFPNRRMRELRVQLTGRTAKLKGSLSLAAPAGWTVRPVEASFELLEAGDEQELLFSLRPEQDAQTGTVKALARLSSGLIVDRSERVIDYDHVPIHTLYPPAEARLVRSSIKTTGEKVGYIMGSGDDVPAALEQLGYQVSLLSDEELASGNLQAYDAIVAGIRAYNTRDRLKSLNARLLKYVENGGTFVVQYTVFRRMVTDEIGPYPFKISWDRVTVEEAPVRLTAPDHPLLSSPNRIELKDFEGWVQERGLYFAGEWDEAYDTPLASNDPGEESRDGGLIYTRYGRGVFVYTGYSFFRQLPAGVPGAFRLFANIIAGGKAGDN